MIITKIISSGQTDVECAALDIFRDFGFPIGGYTKANGNVADYPELTPLDSANDADVARANAKEADVTLILTPQDESGQWNSPETDLVLEYCEAEKLPFVRASLPGQIGDFELSDAFYIVKSLKALCNDENLTVNVVGPRESKWSGGYAIANAALRVLISANSQLHDLNAPTV